MFICFVLNQSINLSTPLLTNNTLLRHASPKKLSPTIRFLDSTFLDNMFSPKNVFLDNTFLQ